MRIEVKDSDVPPPGKTTAITVNDWLAYRVASLGARLIATASRLRETEDEYTAAVSLRASISFRASGDHTADRKR